MDPGADLIQGTASLPLFHIGAKGHDGTPQDAYTTFATAQTYAVLGWPIQDIIVMHASVGPGMVTQFFLSFFGDREECECDPISGSKSFPACRATPSKKQDGEPSGAHQSETDTEEEEDELNLFSPKNAIRRPALTRPAHRLYVVPWTKKLDPFDDHDKLVVARMMVLVRRFVSGLGRVFLNNERCTLKVGVDVENEEDENDGEISLEEKLAILSQTF